jgi:hypothetical protein
MRNHLLYSRGDCADVVCPTSLTLLAMTGVIITLMDC